MHVAIIFLFTSSLIIAVVMAFGEDMIDTYSTLTNRWDTLNGEWEERSNTQINAESGGTVTEGLSISMIVRNTGRVALEKFGDWDVILEVPRDPEQGIYYLSYTTDDHLCPNEWFVKGTYRDASSSTPETVGPGMLDPGEEMVIQALPRIQVEAGTYVRATVMTPNGIGAQLILEVIDEPATLYVIDASDSLVYSYEEDGTFIASTALDASNDNPKGIGTDDVSFWISDDNDDRAYEYATSSLALQTSWDLNIGNSDAEGLTTDGCSVWTVEHGGADAVFEYDRAGQYVTQYPLLAANDHATGITTDLTYFWVADHKDNAVYKYTINGAFDSSFPLDGGQKDSRGFTTDGDNIWVADADNGQVFKYDMAGAFVSSFDLTAENADPQGITVTPR